MTEKSFLGWGDCFLKFDLFFLSLFLKDKTFSIARLPKIFDDSWILMSYLYHTLG